MNKNYKEQNKVMYRLFCRLSLCVHDNIKTYSVSKLTEGMETE